MIKASLNPRVLASLGIVVLIGVGAWAWSRKSRSSQVANTSTMKSCNAVSSLAQAKIDAKDSATLKRVVVDYSLTTTADTGLNCFILATVQDSQGTQVGTWRRSFFHSAPGTYHEHHDLGDIAYKNGETLDLKIIAAEGSPNYRD